MLKILLASALSLSAFSAWAKHTVLTGTDLVKAAKVDIDLTKFNGTTAVVFVSSRCPCSASHEALLKQMAAEFTEVHFVAIHSNADEPEAEAKLHFAKAELPFPLIQDSQAQIATEYGALKTPHVFLVDKNGEVVFSGGVTDSHDAARASKNFLREALLSLRAGKNPDPSEVRSLGCYIARK